MKTDFKLNLDLKTLKNLVDFAKVNGVSRRKTITITIVEGEVGDVIKASAT